MSRQKRIGVFPGTFDPVTKGHIDIIERASKLFDELVIAIGDNPEKTAMLNPAERAEIVREIVADTPDVRVECYKGLTVEFARRIGATSIVRGVRNTSDLHFEFQIALTNRTVAGVETIFMMTNPRYAFTSSSLIRQIASMGGDVSALVPAQVLPHIRKFLTDHTDHSLTESE